MLLIMGHYRNVFLSPYKNERLSIYKPTRVNCNLILLALKSWIAAWMWGAWKAGSAGSSSSSSFPVFVVVAAALLLSCPIYQRINIFFLLHFLCFSTSHMPWCVTTGQVLVKRRRQIFPATSPVHCADLLETSVASSVLWSVLVTGIYVFYCHTFTGFLTVFVIDF